jgi:hypothetical protein
MITKSLDTVSVYTRARMHSETTACITSRTHGDALWEHCLNQTMRECCVCSTPVRRFGRMFKPVEEHKHFSDRRICTPCVAELTDR